jgi:hypothetical protein
VLLYEYVEDFAFVVDRPPEPHARSRDLHDHLVQMPAAGWAEPGSAKVLGEELAKFEGPASDGFVVRLDPPLSQHLLGVPEA